MIIFLHLSLVQMIISKANVSLQQRMDISREASLVADRMAQMVAFTLHTQWPQVRITILQKKSKECLLDKCATQRTLKNP